VIADAGLVARKDLKIELRSRVALGQVLPFVVAVLLLFAFALDAESPLLRRATPGVFWVTTLFAAVLIVQRSFAAERADGILDALRLSGLAPAGIFLGKAAALTVQLLVIEAVLFVGIVVLYDVTLSQIGLLAVTTIAASVAIAGAGAIYGPMAAGTRARDTALPLLMVPALAPVLLGATQAFGIALGHGVGGGWSWAAMLGIFAVAYLALGALVWGPLLEET
jgi:heme exporter protein B